MTQNCQRKLPTPCVKAGQREWTWSLGWCGCNNMQSDLNLAQDIVDPDHNECYFSVSKHIPVQYDNTARCRSVAKTCPVTIHDQDTTSLMHMKKKRFITKGTDCNCKQHVCSLAHRICSGSGGGVYSVTTANIRYSLSSFGSLTHRHAISDTGHATGGTTEQCRYCVKPSNNYLLLTLRQIYTICCKIFQ